MGGFSRTQFQRRTREYPIGIVMREVLSNPVENMSVVFEKWTAKHRRLHLGKFRDSSYHRNMSTFHFS